MERCFKFGEILIPKNVDLKDWAVVACDQYTSSPEYWDELQDKVKRPSAIDIVFPECYLKNDKTKRINDIISKQIEFDKAGLFEAVNGTILVKRTTSYGNERWGLMCLVNLNQYTNAKGAVTPIRATEGLVESRIPPRVEIRKNCLFELPHIMLLIDDESRSVIEPLKKKNLPVAYDGDLNGQGGHVCGYRVDETEDVERALDSLQEASEKKYSQPLLFLVGDGNHSLATAKACVDKNNPLSEYALVEIVNIYDEGLKFEPIHRVLFGVDNDKFLSDLRKLTASYSGKTMIFVGDRSTEISFPEDAIEGVKLLQEYIDEYLKVSDGTVDYVHGEDDLKAICRKHDSIGILLKPIDKSTFFSYVVKNGTLPRKTFSMGEANEKRYYVEARRIK